MSENARWLFSNIVAPVIVAVIIGMGSAYATARLTLESLAGRVTATERAIQRVEAQAVEDVQKLETFVTVEVGRVEKMASTTADRERSNAERLIRLESKIDLLIERMGKR